MCVACCMLRRVAPPTPEAGLRSTMTDPAKVLKRNSTQPVLTANYGINTFIGIIGKEEKSTRKNSPGSHVCTVTISRLFILSLSLSRVTLMLHVALGLS